MKIQLSPEMLAKFEANCLMMRNCSEALGRAQAAGDEAKVSTLKTALDELNAERCSILGLPKGEYVEINEIDTSMLPGYREYPL